MKKTYVFMIIFLLIINLSSCNEEIPNNKNNADVQNEIDEKFYNDKIPPIITIKKSEQNIYIRQGEEYDLMQGISGLDNLEGDITSNIIVSIGDYDNNTPGTYTIVYFLKDLSNNNALTIERTITVLDTKILTAPPLYNGIIENEAAKPNNPAYFGGAWYHKVVSSKDYWVGIDATFTLPTVNIDRYNGSYNSSLDVDPFAQNLDNPSIYMGGNATNESDVGLSFSKGIIDETGALSKGSIVFRPFWRYITTTSDPEVTDVGGYNLAAGRNYAVSATGASGNNMIANWHYNFTEYYYLPGDKLRMLIYSPEPNKLQMQIEVIEVSSNPESVKMRQQYGWKEPQDFKSPIFSSPGHGTNIKAEYKRVNAIDQVANEGGFAHSTTTTITNAIWHEVYLYRYINGEMYRVPFNQERSAYLSARDDKAFTISYDGVDQALGGEIVSIHPGVLDE